MFSPGIVIVMFFVTNDVSDNLPALKAQRDPGMAALSPYLLLDDRGNLLEPRPGVARLTSPLVALASSSRVGQWSYHAYRELRWLARSSPVQPVTGEGPEYDEEAWQVTGQVLIQFAEEVKADGHRFAVVAIPSIFERGDGGAWAGHSPRDLARLEAISHRANFPVLDLTPTFQALLGGGRVKEFLNSCDSHWTAAAHAEAAAALGRFLEDQHWIPRPSGVVDY